MFCLVCVSLVLQQCKYLLHNCLKLSALLISQLVAMGESMQALSTQQHFI